MASYDFETAQWIDELDMMEAKLNRGIRLIDLALAGIGLILCFPFALMLAAL